MHSISLHHFDLLKQVLLLTARITHLLPSECKSLSDSIFKKTHKRISETTLKRVFGFAHSRFNPSLFTIDVMAQYCGYSGWADFCEKQDQALKGNNPDKNTNWDAIKKTAHKITHSSLQLLKNRSGIPFNQTIKRKFIDDHFTVFLQGYYTGTIFIAPAGYGKTIALCHWIDERLKLNALKDRNEVILLFSSNALMNNLLSGQSLNKWILSLLGLNPNDDFETLFTENGLLNNTFYLIIDGFDEHLFKSTQYEFLYNEILDLVSLYKNAPWFKVILTMRSTSYINNKHTMLNSTKAHWFAGFTANDGLATNVPLFNVEEIRALSYKINPNKNHFIGIDLAERFNNPLLLQFHYQNNPNRFSLNSIDQVSIYELIATFIYTKIYQGHHSEEKILLVKGLVENIDFKNKDFTINKLKVADLLKQYKHAYKQLLSLGFLKELNISEQLDYCVFIQFGNTNFLLYSIAKTLLLDNRQVFDIHIVNFINDFFNNSEYKLPLLKWCLINSIKNQQYNCFELLPETNLSANEKADMIIFLGNLFDKKQSSVFKVDQLKSYTEQYCHKALFDYFFGLEFINSDYEQALQSLLKFNLHNDRKIVVYSSLIIVAIIRLDLQKAENYLHILRSFVTECFEQLPVNPLACLEAIFFYLKYGIIKREAFIELTRFCFNPPQVEPDKIGNSSLDVLYLLAIYTLSICQNPRKTLRFINALNKIHKKNGNYPQGYDFFLKSIRADACLSLDKREESIKLFNEIEMNYTTEKQSYTPFMKASFHLLKIKKMLYNNQQTEVMSEMRALIHLSDESGYMLIKVHALAFLLSNQYTLKTNPKYYRQVYYDFIRAVRDSGFRSESFVSKEVIVN